MSAWFEEYDSRLESVRQDFFAGVITFQEAVKRLWWLGMDAEDAALDLNGYSDDQLRYMTETGEAA